MKLLVQHSALLGCFIVSLASCHTGVKISEGGSKPSTVINNDPTASSLPINNDTNATANSDEKIDPPQNIIGHYLHCSYEIAPTDAKPEALVGCRFDNSQAQRIPASTLGASYHFDSLLRVGSKVNLYEKDLAGDNRYDAAFLYIGTSAKQVLDEVQTSFVSVKIKQSRLNGNDLLVGTKFAESLRDPASYAEPRTTDYSAVRDTILVDAQKAAGQPTPVSN